MFLFQRVLVAEDTGQASSYSDDMAVDANLLDGLDSRSKRANRPKSGYKNR